MKRQSTDSRMVQEISVPRRSKLSIELMDDHRLILADFEMLRVGPQQGTNGRSQSILFDRLAKSLGDHFMKEERLLFPLLNHYLGPTVCNQLSTENTEMIRLAKHQGEQGWPSRESLTRLEKLLQTHVSTEENVLLW